MKLKLLVCTALTAFIPTALAQDTVAPIDLGVLLTVKDGIDTPCSVHQELIEQGA